MTRSLLCAALLALALLPARAEEPLRTAPDLPLDVTQIDLDLHVDLEAQRVHGTATLALTARRDVDALRFDAANLTVEAVSFDAGQGAQDVSFSSSDTHLLVHQPLARGKGGTVVVRYAAEQPRAGLYFFKPTADAPQVPYQLWSQGESTGNRWWFPCVDHPAERSPTSLTAHVAKGLTVISNGDLLGVDEGEAEDTWRFRQTREHPSYLVSLIVGSFDVVEDTWRDRPLAYYVPPGRKGDIERSFGETKAMLDFFSDYTGELYPWPKYHQTVVEQFSHGGMENTGATTLNERTLHDERAHLDFSSEGLVAHELAHQWFGDLITCRDWSHIWLNESFATYFQALWGEHRHGVDEFARDMFGKMDAGLNSGNDRPIVDRYYPDPDSVFDGRAYPKGACVLHMLRRRLGDATFQRGIQRYVRQVKDSSVETHQLRAALEQESGLSLERYFHDWLEQPGHPDLEVRLDHDPDAKLATVTVTQTQPNHTYELPLTVVLGWGEGETHSQSEQHQLSAERTVRFSFPSPTPPTWFRFDPREEVLLKQAKITKPRALWIAQLEGDTVWGRIRAARQLRDERHAEATNALTKALESDPSWAVREICAQSLNNRQEARPQLLTALDKEQNPFVRRVLVQALAQLGRDPQAEARVIALLKQGDPSYAVEDAALRALIRVGDGDKTLLEAYLDKPSHNERLRIAAIDSLAALDDAAAHIPQFAKFTKPGYEGRLRSSAARALAVAAQAGTPPERVAEAVAALRPLLRADNDWIKRTALDTLSDLGREARAAEEDLVTLVNSEPNPNLRERAEKTLSKIRSEAEPDRELTRLRETLDRLDKRESELRERLDKLEQKQGAGK